MQEEKKKEAVFFLTTPNGFGFFQLEKDLNCTVEKLRNGEAIDKLVKLQQFIAFKSQEDAIKNTTVIIDGLLPKRLKKILKKSEITKLIVTDSKLMRDIQKVTNIAGVCNANSIVLRKAIMEHFEKLTNITDRDRYESALALCHGLSRYKLKCNPDKIDTMIVQAQSMLEDLDKEINNYVMRCKEMYGWHFPELAKLVDNESYIKFIVLVGDRNDYSKHDLSTIMPAEKVTEVEIAAKVSCGTVLLEDDKKLIESLCTVINSMSERRAEVFQYLKERIEHIAPNLTALCGEVLGAKLIAHAGTLVKLGKLPASTIQIVGAEKALFRSLRKNSEKTPKFGYIYHASLVQKAQGKLQGKVARFLANGTALCARVDAFDDKEDINGDYGISILDKIKRQIERNSQTQNTPQAPQQHAPQQHTSHQHSSHQRSSRSEPSAKRPRLDKNVNKKESRFKGRGG